MRTRIKIFLGALLLVAAMLALNSVPAMGAAITDPVTAIVLIGHDTAHMAQHALGALQSSVAIADHGLTSLAASAVVATTVRAKVRLHSYTTQVTTKYPSGEKVEARTLRFSPVTSGSDENKQFFASTPSGSIELQMVTPEAWGQFELDKEYYLDFAPADAPVSS